MSDRQKSPENIIPMILDLRPLVLETGKHLSSIFTSNDRASQLGGQLRKEAALSLGIVLPQIRISENRALGDNSFAVKIREVAVHKGSVRGFQSQEAAFALLRGELSAIVRRYAYEFVGPEEVEALLTHLRASHPALVQSVYPALLTLPEIQRVLQNLLKEGVPIRDLVRILEVLADQGVHTRDPELLAEYVRHAMPRVLGGLYHDEFVIKAYLVEDKIEQWMSGAVRWENQVILDLDPDAGKKIMKALYKKLKPQAPRKGTPVLLVSPDIRRFMKMLTERALPNVPVLSYNEIAPEYKVKVMGTIRMEPWKDRLGKAAAFFRGGKTREIFPGDDVQKALVVLNAIGPAANAVAQFLSPWEKETLSTRSLIAPVPHMGKDSAIREFLGYLPAEKKTTSLELLCKFAAQEPAVVAAALQRNWLSHIPPHDPEGHSFGFAPSEAGGRDDTSAKEKAAVFISSAARWIQDEVFRFMTVDELKELASGMLQFPFISPDGKRRAWEEYETVLYKDEWWDPDTLVRFLRASMKGEINEFKKRGFRQTQKVAILLLSLPAKQAERIGKKVLEGLTKIELQQVLGEMGQWRDYLPPEARAAVIQEFLDYASGRQSTDFHFSESQLRPEVERIVLRDVRGAVSVLRSRWLELKDARATFETLAARTPGRLTNLLLAYLHSSEAERSLTAQNKISYFLNSIEPRLRESLKSEMSDDEKKDLKDRAPTAAIRKKLLGEFLREYYSGNYPSPLPFLKRN